MADAAPDDRPRLRDTFDEDELTPVVRLLEQMVHDGVVVADEAGRNVYSNPKANEVLRMTSDELLGVTALDPRWAVVTFDGRPYPDDQHPPVLALSQGVHTRGELIGLRAGDESRRWLSVDSSPISLPSGRYAITVFTDVTENIDHQRALFTVHAEIEQQLVQRHMPTHDRLRCAAEYRPAGLSKSVGGDFLGAELFGGDRLGLFIGDVCGHGVGAAGLSSVARHAARALTGVLDDPSDVVVRLHDIVMADRPDMFVTMAYATLDLTPARPRMSLAIGGHPLPILVRDGRAALVGETGPLVGMVPNQPRPVTNVDLDAGDHLYFITDGVLDGGDERLSMPELVAMMPTSTTLDDTVAWLIDQSGAAQPDHGSRRGDDATVLGIEIR